MEDKLKIETRLQGDIKHEVTDFDTVRYILKTVGDNQNKDTQIQPTVKDNKNIMGDNLYMMGNNQNTMGDNLESNL